MILCVPLGASKKKNGFFIDRDTICARVVNKKPFKAEPYVRDLDREGVLKPT